MQIYKADNKPQLWGNIGFFMHTLSLHSHLCPQEYVRKILRDFFRMLCSVFFPSCWLCLSCSVDVRERISVQTGEGRCSKGHLVPMLIICPNQCCYLQPMSSSMRAVGYWVLLKASCFTEVPKQGCGLCFPFEYHGTAIGQMVDTNRFQPQNCSQVVPLKIC